MDANLMALDNPQAWKTWEDDQAAALLFTRDTSWAKLCGSSSDNWESTFRSRTMLACFRP